MLERREWKTFEALQPGDGLRELLGDMHGCVICVLLVCFLFYE